MDGNKQGITEANAKLRESKNAENVSFAVFCLGKRAASNALEKAAEAKYPTANGKLRKSEHAKIASFIAFSQGKGRELTFGNRADAKHRKKPG